MTRVPRAVQRKRTQTSLRSLRKPKCGAAVHRRRGTPVTLEHERQPGSRVLQRITALALLTPCCAAPGTRCGFDSPKRMSARTAASSLAFLCLPRGMLVLELLTTPWGCRYCLQHEGRAADRRAACA